MSFHHKIEDLVIVDVPYDNVIVSVARLFREWLSC